MILNMYDVLVDRCKLLAIALHTNVEKDKRGDEYRSWVTRKGSPTIPYHIHVIRVAKRVTEYLDKYTPLLFLSSAVGISTYAKCQAVSMLHDVVEDVPGITYDYLETLIGGAELSKEIIAGVRLLTKPADSFGNRQERKAEVCRIIREAPTWVKLIKAADRIDNLFEHLDGDSSFAFTRSEKYLKESEDLLAALRVYNNEDIVAPALKEALDDLDSIIKRLRNDNEYYNSEQHERIKSNT